MARVETIDGILHINGIPYVCQNETKDLWVPADQEKKESDGPVKQEVESERVKTPKQPKHGPFGRG